MNADREAMVQAGAVALANVSRLPKWMQVPALGYDLKPVAELVVDALAPFIAAAEQRGREQQAAKDESHLDGLRRGWIEQGRVASNIEHRRECEQLRAEVEQLRDLVRQLRDLGLRDDGMLGFPVPAHAIVKLIDTAGIDLGEAPPR